MGILESRDSCTPSTGLSFCALADRKGVGGSDHASILLIYSKGLPLGLRKPFAWSGSCTGACSLNSISIDRSKDTAEIVIHFEHRTYF